MDEENRLDELQTTVLEVARDKFSGARTRPSLVGTRLIIVNNGPKNLKIILSVGSIHVYDGVLFTVWEELDRRAILDRIESSFSPAETGLRHRVQSALIREATDREEIKMQR